MHDGDHHEIHMFTAAVPEKVEMKDQNIQTETVEFKHQHVQAGTRAQEQGMLPPIKAASVAVLCTVHDQLSSMNYITTRSHDYLKLL